MASPRTPAVAMSFATRWRAIGTTVSVHTTDPLALEPATQVARGVLAELDLAASRFRPDSEVTRLAEASTLGPASTVVSPMLRDALSAALRVARLTDGLVDPTVGSAVIASGYDGDIDLLRAHPDRPVPVDPPRAPASLVPGWQRLRLDAATGELCVPQGTVIDVGSTGKAFAADRIAQTVAERLPGGVLVNLGGDIAVAGRTPAGGWGISVTDVQGECLQVVRSTGQAFATSSTQHRTWRVDGRRRHHIVDPRTGRTAETVWAQVTCAARTALEANAASTAAVVLGHDAPDWLAQRGIPARLEPVDGGLPFFTSTWPDEQEAAA